MKALPTYRISQRAGRRVRSCAALLLVVATASSCADVGDDPTEDASRIDVNYGGRSGGAGSGGAGTSGSANTGGGGAGGTTGSGGQGGSDAPIDVAFADVSIDLSDGNAPVDGPVRIDTRGDLNSPDVRVDTSVGPADAPPEIREAEAGPLCGNGTIDPGEECDDGNTRDMDKCTSICTDNRACLACEDQACPHDSTGCNKVDGCGAQPSCDDYPKDEDKALCWAVVACVVRTGCALDSGPVTCYCGQTSPDGVVPCKDGTTPPVGPCKDEIRAAFKPIPAVPDVNAYAIVNGITDVTSPSGGAMAMANCDFLACGKPELGGNNECVPGKHPSFDGGVDSGAADANQSDGGTNADVVDGKSPDAE